MMKKQWYESLFENYGLKYDSESFTQGTVGECDFIEREINFDQSLKILDDWCWVSLCSTQPTFYH